MKITLNNTEIELEPYRFMFNYVIANANPFAGYGGVKFTQFLEAGQVKNVTEIYRDIYEAHRNDTNEYLSEWHTVAHIKARRQFDPEVTDHYIRERYHHIVGEDRIIVQYQSTSSDTFYLPVYYPPYSPYQNIIALGITESKGAQGETAQRIAAFICNPIYKPLVEPTAMYQGGFYYGKWNDTTHGIEQIQCDFSELSRYPTPDPEIPFTTSDRTNMVRLTANIDSVSILIWNGEPLTPLSPDNDTNQSHTQQGPYHDVSDPVDFSALPSIGPLDTGFIKAYVLTAQKCQELAEFMLTDDFLTNVKKLFANPIDYVISLHFLPVTPSTTTPTTIKIGTVDSEISAPRTMDSYVSFSCGSINLEEFWASFLDYSPSTRISIFIPFVGVRELNTDDVMTGTLTLRYNINVIDGDFVVELHSDTSHKLNGVIATYQGNMLLSTPVTQLDYSNKITAGFTALSQGVMAVGTGNAAQGMGALANAVQATVMKPDFGRSGNVSGGAGMLGNFTPYLIKVRPKQAVPALYTKLFGKPSMIGGAVNIFNGYTEFKRINLSGINCTDTERKEIESLMKGGVFI